MEKRYFGTDGVRDVANAGTLAPETILRLSQALGEVLKERDGQERHVIGLGSDTRISCDMIRAALTAGFTSLGSDVIDFGVLPTPAMAHLTRVRNLDLGLMVSASHNPMADNGIKVFDSRGLKLPDEVERRVEQWIDDRKWSPRLPTGAGLGRASEDAGGLEEYLTHLIGHFKGLDLSPWKVAVDCANGATWKMAPEILTRLGAKVVVMANDPDGTNINLDCGSVHPESLTELVKAEGCDLGVALDGDGDRAQFVDRSGRILNGDHIMAALALHMNEQGTLNRGAVVATVMSNIGLELAMTRAGIRLLRADVGDRHVTARLRKDNLSLGGEQSGHIIFGDENHYTGDGVFTALKVLEVMTGTGKPLHELTSIMKEYPQLLINVEVRHKPPFEEVPSVMDAVRDAQSRLGDEGRVLLRYSGTERKARVMVEGRNVNQVKALAESIAQVVTREMG